MIKQEVDLSQISSGILEHARGGKTLRINLAAALLQLNSFFLPF